MRSRTLRPLATLFTLLSLIAFAPVTGWAEEGQASKSQACKSLITGTYLTTIETVTGDFASRSIVTFHDDGTLAAIDAAQSSGVTGTSFSSQQGSYSCKGRSDAVATTLDFGFPDNANIGRFDWIVSITPAGTIEGEITLNLFTPIDSCNPFRAAETCTLNDLDIFTFTSVRVPAQAD